MEENKFMNVFISTYLKKIKIELKKNILLYYDNHKLTKSFIIINNIQVETVFCEDCDIHGVPKAYYVKLLDYETVDIKNKFLELIQYDSDKEIFVENASEYSYLIETKSKFNAEHRNHNIVKGMLNYKNKNIEEFYCPYCEEYGVNNERFYKIANSESLRIISSCIKILDIKDFMNNCKVYGIVKLNMDKKSGLLKIENNDSNIVDGYDGLKWTDFLVKTRTLRCNRETHKVESGKAFVNILCEPDWNIKRVEFTGFYCNNCCNYFIYEIEYEKLKRIGKIICPVYEEDNVYSNG